MKKDIKWDKRFIELACAIGEWSKDPSRAVGAVIVRPDRTIASHGYNGFPRGVKDTEERLHDKQLKYAHTVHAEVNAILTAKKQLHGYTIYVSSLYPCANCAGIIIQSGIKRVVTNCNEIPEHWKESFSVGKNMFDEAGVMVDKV